MQFDDLLDLLLRSPEADDARNEVCFEILLQDWIHGYSGYFEWDEYYDPRETREAFLQFCGAEFDRQLKDWPWNKKWRGSGK
jgi:hypothetical protein